MCMPTQLRLQDQQQSPPISSENGVLVHCVKIRRITIIASWLNYAKLVLAVLIAVHFLQHAKQTNGISLTTLVVSLSNESAMSRSWAVVYAVVVYVLLSHKCQHLREQVADITTRAVTSSVVTQATASSTEALSKIRSSVSVTSMRLFGVKGKGSGDNDGKGRSLAISQKECFLDEDSLSNLTLQDIQHVFSYAFQSNSADFDLEKFLVTLRPAAQKAIDAIEKVLVASRGAHVEPFQRQTCCEYGSVDALTFAAAVRLFAEWRTLRLVPEGNQRYGVGMGLARRDLVQNVAKIEQAAHTWLSFHQGVYDRTSNQLKAISPTIRQLLQHEIELKVHPKLPQLADKSAASGLLWAKRQIHYQTSVFDNIMQIPYIFPSSKAAVNAAYKEVYGKYHGFFVRHIFHTSFEAAPAASVILEHMNAPYLAADPPTCSSCWSPQDDETVNISADEEEDDDDWIHCSVDDQNHHNKSTRTEDVTVLATPAVALENVVVGEREHLPSPLEQFGDHLVQEWCKFLDFWGQCAGPHQEQQKHPRTAFASTPALRMSSLSMNENVSHPSSATSANRSVADIHGYLQVMRPAIQGLDELIAKLNMNDPTKV